MRVVLVGKGEPIPEIGLPDPNLSTDLPPQTLLLSHGVPFLKADYVGLGYTHYQVTCIGACGGIGGYGTRSPSGWAYPWAVIPGGGGGGGGLHRVSGMLADLPAASPVVVGQPGADGRNDNGDWKHLPKYDANGIPISNEYVLNPNHISALPGDDGGYSSFNGNTCMASGGKGGDPAPQWKSYVPQSTHQTRGPGGNGGKGGLGGTTVAGGGADGGWCEKGTPPSYSGPYVLKAAKDGDWNGTIGAGGGGGCAGAYYDPGMPLYTAPQSLAANELMHGTFDPTIHDAGAGGQGSFSYEDTSVYGVRQSRQVYTGRGISAPIIPGCGGGARLSKLQGYGSRAPGFSPQGAVQIRIFKVA